MVEAPSALRTWFVAHFAVDWAVGIPLLVAPESLLRFFGWHEIDPIATRLFAAALLAIGGQSLLGRNGSVNEFRAMLNLKADLGGSGCDRAWYRRTVWRPCLDLAWTCPLRRLLLRLALLAQNRSRSAASRVPQSHLS